MAEKITGFAAWHPTKGFDDHAYEGPVAFADLDGDGGVLDTVEDLNDLDGTHTKNGWRVVKVEIHKVSDVTVATRQRSTADERGEK